MATVINNKLLCSQLSNNSREQASLEARKRLRYWYHR